VVSRRALPWLAGLLALASCHPGKKHGNGPGGEDTLVGSWKGSCVCVEFRVDDVPRFDGFPGVIRSGVWHRESRELVSLESDAGVETVQVTFHENDDSVSLAWVEDGGPPIGVDLLRESCQPDGGGQ